MPHLTVHALEGDLAGREAALADVLTDSIAAVYGEWARELVTVRLIGLPVERLAVGGRLVRTASPAVTLGVREAMFTRPDAEELIRKLIGSLTDAVGLGVRRAEQGRYHGRAGRRRRQAGPGSAECWRSNSDQAAGVAYRGRARNQVSRSSGSGPILGRTGGGPVTGV